MGRGRRAQTSACVENGEVVMAETTMLDDCGDGLQDGERNNLEYDDVGKPVHMQRGL